jgi:acyl carrier protein
LDNLSIINQILISKFDLTIGQDQDLFDAGGIDSLDFAELVSELEYAHNLEIPIDAIILDWTKLRTTEGLASVLRKGSSNE